MNNKSMLSRMKNVKSISPMMLYSMGVPKENFQIFDTIEELRQNPPNIIIAQCTQTVKYLQNDFPKEQCLMKKEKYVMAAGVYQQLHFDPRTKLEFLKPAELKFKNI